MKILRTASPICLFVALGACAQTTTVPLLFGQTQTLGVSMNGASQQGAELTLGYRDSNFAIVPVSERNANGNVVSIRSNATGAAGGRGTNALSVLGQFDATAAGRDASVKLGKFFATGLAADKLADGFRNSLSK